MDHAVVINQWQERRGNTTERAPLAAWIKAGNVQDGGREVRGWGRLRENEVEAEPLSERACMYVCVCVSSLTPPPF